MLTSSNKSETAVHSCDPALSVLVMLVSRNVFHVVSALQSIAFIHIFLADQISCRSYAGSVYRMRSLAVYSHSKLEPAILLRDSNQWMPCFDRCQLTITRMSNIKARHCKPRLHVSFNLLAGVWSPSWAKHLIKPKLTFRKDYIKNER